MKKIEIRLSDVLKKDLRIVGYLAGSWLIGLGIIYASKGSLPKEGVLLGVIPLLNYIAYRINEELKGEGYGKIIRNK